MADLVIRGATVVDGLGHDPIRADVAVKDGRISEIGDIPANGAETVDAGGLTLMPGIIDIHTHYDAQVTWDPTLSPSPSLGVTTAVMGNCGFGIVPSPPHLRDLIMRNLAVVEGMDIDALRAGIDWRFQSFAEYLNAVRGAGPYANLAVLVGHSAVRTAVMGDEASVRKDPTPAELAEMKRLVGEAMNQGAIGLGASYSPNHSGWGGIPMPSTISDISEFEALVEAMGGPGRGVVEIASGTVPVDTIAGIAGRHGRRIFMTTGVAFYNEQYPERGLGMFEAAAAAQARGQEVYLQFTCQPLSFDFTLAAAYPFYSHPAFDPIKAYDRDQLKAVFQDQSWRDSFRDNLRNPRPGTIFQGNWDRVIVAAPATHENAGLANRSIAEIVKGSNRDPLDTFLDLGLDENLDTGFVGRFLNAVDEGVEPLVKHKAGVIALSDAGAHLVYLCDAGFGLYLLGHWVRERGAFDIVEGVRRLTSHQAGLYGIPDRGRIAIGAHADLLLFDPATVHISPPRRVNDLPAGGQRTLRDPVGVHGVYVNGTRVFDGRDYAKLSKGPGRVLDRFLPARETSLASAAQ
ncbi:MAG TPA: amidohydrolase family protein [Stellaceae bacterium]|jgi:N-acyl-D-aspartate/D-glutamate deacylase|nr:amidohydrolase family protein [Stellaceae bacterium]